MGENRMGWVGGLLVPEDRVVGTDFLIAPDTET